MKLWGILGRRFQTIRFDLCAYYASEWRSQFPPLVRIYYPWHKENNKLRKLSWNLEEADNTKSTFATGSSSTGARMLFRADQLQARSVAENAHKKS